MSSTSTFLLRSCLSSGLMTFSLIFPFSSSPPALLLPGRLRLSTDDVTPESLGLGEDSLSAGLRWRTVGVGKLFRLSTASTVRSKRRKRAWARRRVEGRSIVFESSLTIRQLVRSLPLLYCTSDKRNNIPYFNTSSKRFRCSMMTSRCFSNIAKAMKRWKLLLM